MISQVIDISIPTLTFLLMCIIGMELVIRDFRRVIESPLIIFTAILGQIFILPLCGIAVTLLLDPPSGMVIGLLLLAVCPGGALSNLYVYLLAGNVALSVILTSLTTLLAVSYTPIIGIWLLGQLGHRIEGEIASTGAIAAQLFYYVLIPVIIGMLIRSWNEGLVTRWRGFMQISSALGVIALVSIILLQHSKHLLPSLATVAPIAIGFSVLAMLVGYILSALVRAQYPERIAIMIEFGVRNIPIALLIAANFSGKGQAQLFAATYFVIHAPVVIMIGYLMKKVSSKPN